MEWNPVNWEFDIIFIYWHIAHRMQTMQRGRCNRRLWCLREVQRLERQNEPLLDINLSMMKKQFVFVRYGICKRKQTKVLHPACLAEGRITGTFWCKSRCKMGSKKKRRQVQDFPDEVSRELVRQKIAGSALTLQRKCEKTQISCFPVCVAQSAPIRNLCGDWISWSLHRTLDSVFILVCCGVWAQDHNDTIARGEGKSLGRRKF